MDLKIFFGKEKKLFLPTLIVCLVNGAIMPIFGLFFALIQGKLIKFLILYSDSVDPTTLDYDKDSLLDDINFYILITFIISIIAFVSNYLQMYLFNYMSEQYGMNLKAAYFRRLLFQDMVYFNKKGNEPGNLTQKIFTSCSAISSFIANSMGIMI